MARTALLLFMPALIAGCSDKGDRSHLAETSWRFVQIDGQRPAPGTARMTFDASRIGVQVGCNHLGGPWRMDENRLFAGPLAQTEMDCSAPSWKQEKAVSALLVATPVISVEDDRMTLHSSGHTAELVRVEKTSHAGSKGG